MISNKKGFYVSLFLFALSFVLLGLDVFSDNFINIILASIAFFTLIGLVVSLNRFRVPIFFIGLIWLVYFSATPFSFLTGIGVDGYFHNNILWISLILTGLFLFYILFAFTKAAKMFERSEVSNLKQEKNLKKAEGKVAKSLEISQAKEAGWVALCNEELDLLYKLYGTLKAEGNILNELKSNLDELKTVSTSELHTLAAFRLLINKLKGFRSSSTLINTLDQNMKKSKLFKGAL